MIAIDKLLSAPLTVIFTVVLSLITDPVVANDGSDSTAFCTQTAKAALKACRAETKDDFWITVGNCNNLSNADDRKVCEAQARVTLVESNEECGDQRDARLEVCALIGEAPYDPLIDPANFVDPAEIGVSVAPNPYLPLIPGAKWVYKGGAETITVTVTEDTKIIQGVTIVVVKDTVDEEGELIEDTDDWYAQDIYGNVWYFGEIARNFEGGELTDIDGSWKAGVDGAKAGILFEAMPQVGDTYRQEFALGEAEDLAQVLSITGTATAPAASCANNCLVTRDFTPLEPEVEEHKYYAPGIGLILELDPLTGERVELVEISTP